MNLLHYFHTIRKLRREQVYYRLWYKAKRYFFRPSTPSQAALKATATFPAVKWHTCLPGNLYNPKEQRFHFLNREHNFGNEPVNWDFDGYGKLWTYNLNYFSWLEDETIPVEDRLWTVQQYTIAKQHHNGDEPYPTSLRGIHWIQFISRHHVNDTAILKQLHTDYQRLAAFPEYHLGANHLLENAFSLYWGAAFFKEKAWRTLAMSLLRKNLQEQVLPDGAHYERSPMYHCLLLYRLLQCIELAREIKEPAELLQLMTTKATAMLGWLQSFCFKDHTYACMGDATYGIAPTPADLYAFARQLGIICKTAALSESGYRRFNATNWEMVFNTGNITSGHQPGHTHADSLHFCLQVNGLPFITDTGISTYETGAQRIQERSTAAHNTISIDGINSSRVWKSFRMGRRATVTVEQENEHSTTASHNGYRQYNITHTRTIDCSEKKITVTDLIKNQKAKTALLHLHFHPSVHIQQESDRVFTGAGVRITLKGITGAQMEQYNFCEGFNKTKMAQKLVVTIHQRADLVLEF